MTRIQFFWFFLSCIKLKIKNRKLENILKLESIFLSNQSNSESKMTNFSIFYYKSEWKTKTFSKFFYWGYKSEIRNASIFILQE